MPVGSVKWYDCRKGFGFILDGYGNDVFVHYTVIEGDGFRRLFDGEQVEYDVAKGPKGLLASRVKRLSPDPRHAAKGEAAGKKLAARGGAAPEPPRQ